MGYRELWHRLTPRYDDDEAKAIVRLILEEVFDLSPTDIYCGKVEQFGGEDLLRLERLMQRLEQGEPVQYVLGVAEFCGRRFHVEPGVLIPRPETEELCRWIEEETGDGRREKEYLLDIGTGSGCIAVTLALDIADSKVTAWDISDDALRIARQNAERIGVLVSFERQDALSPPEDEARWDVIVSNPPYIDETTEREAMASNVLDYEPHIALFGPKDEPDLFYKRIGDYAIRALKPGGTLYFELNPLTADSVARHLSSLGFREIEIRKDQFGKNRFLKTIKI